jgi:hypothetical protein
LSSSAGWNTYFEVRVGLANVTKVVVPLVDGRIGLPDRRVACLVLSRSAADDGLVLEWNGVGPAGFLNAGEILRLLLLASGGRVGGDLGGTCVRHGASVEVGSGCKVVVDGVGVPKWLSKVS